MATAEKKPRLPIIVLPTLYPECAACNLAETLIEKVKSRLDSGAVIYQMQVTCVPEVATDTKMNMSLSVRFVEGEGVGEVISTESSVVVSPGRTAQYKQIIKQGPSDDRLVMLQ